jgi:TatD DNase family protein
MLVDTHCHLADPAFDQDRVEVLNRAWTAGVGHIVVIGESRAVVERVLSLVAGEPRLSATVGIHPHDASGFDGATGEWQRTVSTRPEVVAIGETGLDYHYDHSPRPAQRIAFEQQLALAAELDKPAVVHAREADEDVASILRNHPRTRAILHSFSSGPSLLRAALDLGHYVSLSGMVTFKNWVLDAAVREVHLDRLLVETDAPYLAPVPYRGKRNEPAFVRAVAERIATVRGLSSEELIAVTGANAARVFGSRIGVPERSVS